MISRFLVVLFLVGVSYGLNNGLGRTPQMGWNSWYNFWCHYDEKRILQTVDIIVSSGLAAAGYEYVNLDDCWQVSRDANGTIVADPVAFPGGMKALADYVHSRKLKFGLYSDAGYKTCGGRPGSLGYEKKDANTYASWGVDFLKYDNCNTDGSKPEVRYPVMRDALNATGRPIFYSLCEWGVDTPALWAADVGNSWRTGGDISDTWDSMMAMIDISNQFADKAGPGGWNDPDMLRIGNGGMTNTEYVSYFSLWAIAKAPLLIGGDVTNMSQATFNIYLNREVIAVNQDSLGVQGKRINSTAQGTEIWAGPLADGSQAVVLLNRNSPGSEMITVKWTDLGWPADQKALVRDLWTHQDVGTFTGSYMSPNIERHAVQMLKVTPMH